MGLPEDLVNQFRVVAQERLERIEAAWAQMLVALSDESTAVLHREVHTLKGESRVLGFTDVNLVCHKLEDLLEVARARGYAVDEDFDLTINMALRFMGMLVRKRVGSQLSGIDLPGFVRQIDQILNEARPEVSVGRARTGNLMPIRTVQAARISSAVRERLSSVAVDTFIEYAASRGNRRNRLRTSWHALREMVGIQRALVGAGQLLKHKSGALALARDLGKTVEVLFEPGTAEVTTEVLAAIDVAVLHLVRNAVDHGIETPAAREASGKIATGRIRIRGGMRESAFVLVVEDDGRGIQFERVRARAVALGMVSKSSASGLDRDKLVDLMCQPGFSTRAEANEVSGRGVGLDAARAGITELGGTITAKSEDGRGTTWTVSVPVPTLTLHGFIVRAAGVPFPLVIDGVWQVVPPTTPAVGGKVIDIADVLGLGATSAGMPVRFRRDNQDVVLLVERSPVPAQVRRIVPTPATAVGEVVVIDSLEALLLRPDRL
jgi:two-component system, chemotaxis family, sensor kinase CheA